MTERTGSGSPQAAEDGGAERARGGFGRLWAAASVSQLGDGMHTVAMPLLAAGLSRDPLAVSAVAAAGYLPWLVSSLIGGVLVDRLERRLVMALVDLVRAGLVAVLVGAVLSGLATIWLLVLIAFLLGVGETLVSSASQALVPTLVGTGSGALERANARLQLSRTTGRDLVGQGVGGMLYGVAAAVPFAVNAVSFAASSAFTFSLGKQPRRPADGPLTAKVVRREIGEAFTWLRANPLLARLAALVGAFNLATMAWRAVFVLYAADVLGTGGAGYGVLMAVIAVGGVLGSMLGPRVRPLLGSGRLLVTVLAGEGCGLLVLGFTRSPVWAAVLLALCSAGIVMWNVTTASVRQRLVPQHLFGRVVSVYLMVGLGCAPLGAAAGGLLARLTDTATVFHIAGAFLLLLAGAALALARDPALRQT